MFGDLGLTRFPVNDPVNNICCPCMFDAASDSVQAPLFGALNIAWVTLQAWMFTCFWIIRKLLSIEQSKLDWK